MDDWVTLGAMYKDGVESPYSCFRSTPGCKEVWGTPVGPSKSLSLDCPSPCLLKALWERLTLSKDGEVVIDVFQFDYHSGCA